jgi:hypothetical protein
VAAFLTKSDKATGEDSSSSSSSKAKGADSSSSSSEGGASGADNLYEVGTFAQVHTMMSGDSPDSAQLLLLGHRRLKRGATVSACVCVGGGVRGGVCGLRWGVGMFVTGWGHRGVDAKLPGT